MLSSTIFKKEIKSNYKILLIFLAIIFMYVTIMVYMFDPKLSDMFKQFEKVLPEMMSAFGMISKDNSMISFLNSYLFGFILLIFPMVFYIMLANRLVVKYVDSGSMSCILATPNKRLKVILTQISIMVLSIFILISFATIIAIITSEIMFKGELDIKNYILMSFSLFLLHLAISSISFFASCLFNESRHSYLIGAGIPILFYIIKMLANMGGKLEGLKYATIFTLLPSDEIALGNTDVLPQIISLIAISIIIYSLGAIIFTKKDLPL